MSDEFSLRNLVRSVLLTEQTEDLDAITKEVQRRISDSDIPAALWQALRPYVHDVLQTVRYDAVKDARKNPPKHGSSRKVAAIRDAWSRYLDEIRYSVRDGSSRRLGDLTRDDVIFLAGDMEKRAREIKVRAMSMKAIAEAMSEHDAKTVRELPVDYLREMFAKPAA